MAKMNESGILTKYLKETVRLEETQMQAVTSGRKLVVVTAGAGTGKTLTLAWRFLWLVAAEGVPVDAILTITFTEKAALEMRERIKNLLEDLLGAEPGLAHRLRPALGRLDEAYISTIHAFSMRALKENALGLDLDPEARIISGSEDTAFWLQLEHLLDRTDFGMILQGLGGDWASRGKEIFNNGRFPDLLNTFGPDGITSFIRDFISHFASRGLTPEDIWNWSLSPENADKEVSANLAERYRQEWHEAFSLWLEHVVPFVDSKIGLDNDRTNFSSRLKVLRDNWTGRSPGVEELARFIMELLDEEGPLHALNNSKAKNAAEDILVERTGDRCITYRDKKEHWLSVARFVADGFPAPEAQARRLLLAACALCWKFRDSNNHARGILTFDDLVRYAARALEANPSYRDRFRHVLVDEFQDTDGLQYEMIRTISQDSRCSLFLVGDLQQSIYRFRHAEPLIFWKVLLEARQDDDGEEIPLRTSFRSREELMKRVNGLFSSLWGDRIAEEISRPYEPLFPPSHHFWWEKRQGGTLPAAEGIVAVPGDDSEPVTVQKLRRSSLEALAGFFDEALTGGGTVWDPKKGELRPLRFRDIAILVPTRTQYEALEEVLIEGWGFPVYFEGNRNYFSRGEVRDVAAALKAMADPEDDLALASFLSSPLSGLSLSEATGLLGPREGAKTPGQLFPRLASIYPEKARRFRSLRLKARVLGPSALVSGFLEDERTLLAFPSWKRRRVAANLRRAVDIAREYEAYMDSSLPGCAEYLETVTARGIQAEEADVLGEQEDMIRVMTIHAAKGLEFPVVALAGLEYSGRSGGNTASILPSTMLGAVTSKLPLSWDGEEQTLGKKLHRLLDESENLEEQERLLYVACTRARDTLVLCGVCKDVKDEPAPPKHSWLETILSKKEESAIPVTFVTPKKPGSGSRTSDPRKETASGPVICLPADDSRCLERLSATAFSLFRFCPFAWRMRYRQGLDLKWESPMEESHGGAEAGSLAHWILARWDLEPGSLEKWLPRDGEKARQRIPLLPPELRPVARERSRVDLIRRWLENFALSPMARTMKESDSLKREVPFRVRLEEGPVIIGAIDALYEEGNAYHLLDYKVTASGGAPDFLYEAQLAFYAVAAWTASGVIPSGTALYNLPEGKAHPFVLDELRLEQTREEIRQTARDAARGPFEPARRNCPVCPWKESCPAERP